ncbi:hypothetical protein S245_011330, partial [Arachis hypogaea]
LAALESLNLNRCCLSDEEFENLSSLKTLKRLSLAFNRITDACLVHLKGLVNLEYLNLDSCKIGNKGLANLTGLTLLRSLVLSDTEIGSSGLRHISGLTNLKSLNLDARQITDVGLANLTSKLFIVSAMLFLIHDEFPMGQNQSPDITSEDVASAEDVDEIVCSLEVTSNLRHNEAKASSSRLITTLNVLQAYTLKRIRDPDYHVKLRPHLSKEFMESSKPAAELVKLNSKSEYAPGLEDTLILTMKGIAAGMQNTGLCSFRKLIASLVSPNHDDVPPVTCIVSDGAMWFTLKVAQEFHIPHFVFFTPSACGMLGYINFEEIRKRGYFPLKDEKNLLDGYLDTEVDWIPAMKGARLKDFPTFLRTTNPSDVMFNYNIVKVNTAMHAKGVILNTFEDLESEVLDAIRAKYSNVYSIGPLSMLFKQLSNSNTQLESIDLNLWKEDNKCLEWLDKRDRGSVVYVNYGSLVIMTPKQLSEFAWGLINNKYHFLWVIRPNLVHDNNNNGDRKLSDEYVNVIERCERGLVLGWCQQEKVLCHASIGGFLTHCGWNSTLESICEGVPMACWPFFAEQQTNSFYACKKWGIGMEIE